MSGRVHIWSVGFLLMAVSFFPGCSEPERGKPNIILIIADDLGYGDTGPYGQSKIETPNIDRLAAEGLRFTHFYAGSPVCAPSRCVLLTGMHTGHSQVRGNDEWEERGDVWSYRAMIADSTLEGQKPLAESTVTIASLLQRNGYITGAVGKWGLGAPHTDGRPVSQGFDFFYGYNCQRIAHTYYPTHLWRNNHRVWLRNDTLAPHTGLDQGSDPLDPASYEKYSLPDYAPDLMFREILGFIDSCSGKPFFLYWATPIPHLALQAPEEWVNRYHEKFGEEPPYNGNEGYFPVRYPHATYAAMISYLDDQIGSLITHLKERGIYENTIIFFTSDNGPAWSAGTDPEWFASASPFRGSEGYGKGSLNEGGIRVPLIASWPGVTEPGGVTGHLSAFQDFLPTICEITGTEIPGETDGISFLAVLRGGKQKDHDYLYWEFPEYGGQQAVLIGRYKALRKGMHNGNDAFALYDLENDPQESVDISADHPEIMKRVGEIIRKEHNTSGNPRWRYRLPGE
ncbi:MAG TPA: arylsulfatase [Bacteroidales bacterium]|jgi:arylsulfatase A-like enzyme|nr:sulfatase-like hydrolase/transferase [Bacteroidales bacterium]HNV65779.1 arylsulfatase [Bacteroidales bacterium]HNY57044.1 arylsulfatase [Bacteroidales bacterium]HOC04242.1 arylsulfatase [Bacteroidales bacterium]HOH14508.1 arylsulfatase [Bacteroidales bacterium]